MILPQDIVDWVVHSCQHLQIESSLINVSGFAALTSSQLATMSEDQFKTIEPVYGRELFQALAPYKKLKPFGKPFIYS